MAITVTAASPLTAEAAAAGSDKAHAREACRDEAGAGERKRGGLFTSKGLEDGAQKGRSCGRILEQVRQPSSQCLVVSATADTHRHARTDGSSASCSCVSR